MDTDLFRDVGANTAPQRSPVPCIRTSLTSKQERSYERQGDLSPARRSLEYSLRIARLPAAISLTSVVPRVLLNDAEQT